MSSSVSTDQASLDRNINTPPETDMSATSNEASKALDDIEDIDRSLPKKKTKAKTLGKLAGKHELSSKDKKKKNGKSKKSKDAVSSSDEDSDESEEETESESESSDSSDSSEDEKLKRKRKLKEKQKKKAKKISKKAAKKGVKKGKKSRRDDSSSESESGSGSDTDDSAATESSAETTTSDEDVDDDDGDENLELAQMKQLMELQQQQIAQFQLPPPSRRVVPPASILPATDIYSSAVAAAQQQLALTQQTKRFKELGLDAKGRRIKADASGKKGKSKGKDKEKVKAGSKLDFKRVDQLWDTKTHQYKLSDTAADDDASTYDQYLFNVKRTFDWEGQYKATIIDVKSKLLKEALAELLEGIRGVSLAEETPSIDPNFLFLYLEDLRSKNKGLRKQIKNEKMKRKLKKRNELKYQHVKVLLKYLDTDYAETKKTLYPMLESGLITFELLWALYKPNTIVYTTTYGTTEQPRAFKVEYAEKDRSFTRGEYYSIEGKYLEYDGKTWGLGDVDVEVSSFKGARKITSLGCYPLKYHKNETKLRKELIERGKKFVSLQGVQYKSHEGLAYVKRRRQVIKVNINGRIMVDPAIHRRINPNYAISTVKAKEAEDFSEDESDSDNESCGCGDDEEEETSFQPKGLGDEENKVRMKRKVVFDDKNKPHVVEVEVNADGEEIRQEKLAEVPSKKEDTKEEDKNKIPVFTDEEYLIASPVVLGFAFAEKLWLEFTVSGIKDITWNEGAYESLVLENNTKDIVKALVESHKYHPAQSIDDVIQGKGKGLVAVLHGPPGTGKTLTAEGISEFLKCPLYMVSAGELGTDPRTLEGELQKILDIAHAWGAVLLLDEADVFLEKRTIQDIHRNALVSIFLRLLEYFQGILFLTTNRVETFDDAFQSRIHIALRYGALSLKAKKAVFKMFIEKARALDNSNAASAVSNEVTSKTTSATPSPTASVSSSTTLKPAKEFSDSDYTLLAKYELNGRQIKNTVRTAQALAVNKGEVLGMSHLKKVLEVAVSFDRDLRGGTGYEDAMRSYT